MSSDNQAKQQRKSMLSQRFDKRKGLSAGQKRGRPKAKVYRKNVSLTCAIISA